MGTLKLLQQRYRERQKELGRKTITIQLLVDLINALHSGKQTDTLSAYVEHVIQAGLKTVTNNNGPAEVVEEATKGDNDWDADEKKFADDIEASKYRFVQMLADSGNTAGAIAKKLTFEGYPAPVGNTRWTAATVRAILRKGFV